MIDLILIPLDAALFAMAICTLRWAWQQNRHARLALKALQTLQDKQERLWADAYWAIAPDPTTYTTLAEALLPELPEPEEERSNGL